MSVKNIAEKDYLFGLIMGSKNSEMFDCSTGKTSVLLFSASVLKAGSD